MHIDFFKIQLSIFFLFLLSNVSFAQDTIQTKDSKSADTNIPDFVLISGENAFASVYDSILLGTHVVNPVMKKSVFSLYTGNLGAAVWPGQFSREPLPLKLQYGLHPYDSYDFGINSGILKKKRIFTSLHYARGSKKEQYFLAHHKQRIGLRSFAGLDLAAGASQGYYARQLSSLRNFALYGMYNSNNFRYRLYGKFIYNKVDCQENGGLTEDSTLVGVNASDTRTLPILLDDAQRIHKEKAIYLQQQFFITKPVPDLLDTSGYLKKQRIKLDLTHAFHFSDKGTIFKTSTVHQEVYPSIYYDSLTTFDSTHIRSYYNDLKVNLFIRDLASIQELFDVEFYAGASNQSIKVNQRDLDTLFDDWSAYGGMNLVFLEMCTLDLKLNRSIRSVLKESSLFESGLTYRAFNDFLVWGVRFTREEKNPELIYLLNYSNHFKWSNRYDNLQNNRFNIRFDIPFLGIYSDVSWVRTRNYLYFDEDAIPHQFSGKINLFGANLKQQLRYRGLHVENRIFIQTTDNSRLVRLPRYSTYHSLCYELSFFKKALLTQVGVDLRYHSAFYAPYYHPATGQFILQDESAYGDYLFADIFINFKVKTARFFFKVEHLNAGWNKKNYMLLAHYPMQGRLLKFGLTWNLFD